MWASAVGNGLEWFDWNLAIIFSVGLAGSLFDKTNPASALLSTFAVLGVGFLFRPLGGVMAGWLADRYGRRSVMVVTMLTMSAASLAIAVLPTYDQVGTLASLLLLLARMAQGLAHGAESTAGYIYIAEIAPRKRRGLWSATLSMGVIVGSIAASLMGFVLNATLLPAAVADWGWRIPFAIGAVLAVVALILRARMIESDVFTEVIAEDTTPPRQSADGACTAAPKAHTAPEASTVAAAPVSTAATPEATRSSLFWAGFRVFWFAAAIGLVFYTWLTSASALAIAQKGMDQKAAFACSIGAQIVCVSLMPFAGAASDKWGRRPVALTFALGFVVLSFPLLSLISSAPWTLLVAQTVALIFVAMGNSIYSALIAEQFPPRHRAKGVGIAMSLGTAIFGGSALYLNQWFFGLGMPWLFTVYFMVICAIAAVAIWFMPETKGKDLR